MDERPERLIRTLKFASDTHTNMEVGLLLVL
jgi:hypothetical protein